MQSSGQGNSGDQLISPAQRAELEALLRQLNQRPDQVSQELGFRERQLAQQHKREDFAGVATVFLLFPLIVAVSIRMIRNSKPAAQVAMPMESERLTRLEQAVDAIAVEIERIGEAQRFQTKLMSENTSNAARPQQLRPIRTPV